MCVLHSQSNRRSARHMVRRAFTLLEIIVVVTIIAMLAALVGPRVLRYLGSSKINIAKAECAQIEKSVQLWCADNGMTRPPDDFDLGTLVDAGLLKNREELTDPWNREYIIVIPGEKNPDFDILSYGADGDQGGEGEDADIIN
jgi:general secretion pathway protein G